MVNKKTISKDVGIPKWQFNKVVIGLEMNEMDDVILNYLSALFEKVGFHTASIVHVIPSIPLVDVLPYEGMDEIVLDSEWVDAVRSRLREKTETKISLKSVEYLIKEGSILEGLVEESNDQKDHLLVIGQESESGDRDLEASSIVRNSRGNVLVIPEKCTIKFSKILVPIDFSNSSIQALEYAIEIAGHIGEGVSMECVHVYGAPDLSSYKVSKSPTKLEAIFENHYLHHLNKLLSNYAVDFPIRSRVVRKEYPSVARYILNHANRAKCDMIVLGRKGHSKLEQLLMGSVPENLMKINKSFATFVIK